jgi:crotonyl-CoA reductase
MEHVLEAVLAGASSEEIGALEVPSSYRGAHIRAEDVGMFEGLESDDKDPRQSIHVSEVPTPELMPDEVAIAVMASSINFNTVWTSIFEPIPTFAFLNRYGQESRAGARHDLPTHVMGSDAAGVVLRVGEAVRDWKPGDHVNVHGNHVDGQDPMASDDSMLASSMKAWGFETNFGGLADLCVVKASQLLRKPAHLTWEESAVNPLCASTSYRMLISQHGARMKLGDSVLIWGATGGIGIYAVELVQQAGGIPVGVVSSPERVELLHRLGVEHVIDRKAEGYRFWADESTQDEKEWRRFGKQIRSMIGEDPDIVFEHPGRSTMGASVFVAKRGGVVVTCAATTGYMLEYDNRHLWMKLKRIVASHFANYRECWETNELIRKGIIQPCLSDTYDLSDTGEATYQVQHNLHEGKLAIRCLAPENGMGVTDPALRERIGEDKITRFQRAATDLRPTHS